MLDEHATSVNKLVKNVLLVSEGAAILQQRSWWRQHQTHIRESLVSLINAYDNSTYVNP